MAKMSAHFIELGLNDNLIGELATKALTECGEVLVDETKKALKGSATRGYSSGAMAESVKASKPKKSKNGAYIITAQPTGKDKKGVRNAEKAFYLEYGTSKETAKPWQTTAKNNAESRCQTILQNFVNNEVSK